jgi:hypothetical protein
MKRQRQRHLAVNLGWVGTVGLTVVAVLALSAPAPAAAQMIERAARPRAETWQASAGLRTMLVRSAGYDPFSGNDVLPQFSLGIERLVVRSGALVFAAGIGGDYGRTSSRARGASSELTVGRISLIAEGRYQPWERGYGFVRVAPGWLGVAATLTDASSPNGAVLEDSFGVLSADISAGAAARLSPAPDPVAAWVTLEGGYAWAASHHLRLAPGAAPRDQAKLAPLDLGTIDPRGVFFRLALVITY